MLCFAAVPTCPPELYREFSAPAQYYLRLKRYNFIQEIQNGLEYREPLDKIRSRNSECSERNPKRKKQITKDKNQINIKARKRKSEIRKEALKIKWNPNQKSTNQISEIWKELSAMSYEQTALYPMPHTLHLIVTKDQWNSNQKSTNQYIRNLKSLVAVYRGAGSAL